MPNSALQCITDRSPCCKNVQYRHGQWYLPNRTQVQGPPVTLDPIGRMGLGMLLVSITEAGAGTGDKKLTHLLIVL